MTNRPGPRVQETQGGRSTKTTRRQGRINWEDRYLKELLYYLYQQQNHTAEQVSDELLILYRFRVAPSTLQKKFSEWADFRKNGSEFDRGQNESQGSRGAQSLPNKKWLEPTFPLVTSSVRPFASYRSQELLPTMPLGPADEHKIKALHAIRRLIYGIFDQSKTGKHLLDPGFDDSSPWDLVHTRCQGLTGVSRMSLGTVFNLLVTQLLAAAEVAAPRAREVGFLIRIWKICLCLLDLKLPIPRREAGLLFLRLFLCHLGQHLAKSFRNTQDDLIVLIRSILYVLSSTPLHIKAMLDNGCEYTARLLGRLIGESHPVLLSLVSSWRGYRKSPGGVALFTLPEPVYQSLLSQSRPGTARSPTPKDDYITVLHDYTLFQRHNSPETTPRYVDALHAITSVPCREATVHNALIYDQTTRAYADSAELLAICQLDPLIRTGKQDRARRDLGFQAVSDAVEVLRLGSDLDCLVRALQLSSRLATWKKTCYHGQSQGRSQWSVTMQILSRIAEIQHNVVMIRRPEAEAPDDGLGSLDRSKRLDEAVNVVGKNRNARYRQRKREKSAEIVRSVWDAGQKIGDGDGMATVLERRGPRGPRSERRAKKGPDQTPPRDPDPVHRTCRHCGQVFPSRRQHGRHLKQGCAEEHAWVV